MRAALQPKMQTEIPEAGRPRRTALVWLNLAAITGSLRHRNFRLFFFGYLISLTGIWMQWVAQMWLILKMTDSPFLLGCLSFAGNTPIFLLAPLGGALADRLYRKHILLVTQSLAMLSALGLALLTLSGHLQVWHIFAFALATGIINAFDIPTHQAFLSDVVEKEDLMNAIALNSSVINCTRIIGPALAGLLLASVGGGWCFLLNSLSFTASIGCILLMREVPRQIVERQRSAWRDMLDGFSYTSRNALACYVLILIALLSLIGMSYTMLLPIHADRILQSGPDGLGQLIGATGAGALLAALGFAGYGNRKRLAGWIVLSSILFSLGLLSLSFSGSFRLSIILLFLLGFSQVVQLDASNKLLQLTVPDEMRGRMMSFYVLVMMGLTPCGALAAGLLAKRFGVSPTMTAFGAVYLICAGLVGSRLLSVNASRS